MLHTNNETVRIESYLIATALSYNTARTETLWQNLGTSAAVSRIRPQGSDVDLGHVILRRLSPRTRDRSPPDFQVKDELYGWFCSASRDFQYRRLATM